MLLSSPPPMPVSPAVSPDFMEQKKSVLTPRSEISLADAKSHLKPASSVRCPDPGLRCRLQAPAGHRQGRAGQRGSAAAHRAHFPAGRWPAAGQSLLFLSQLHLQPGSEIAGCEAGERPGAAAGGSWEQLRRRGGNGRKRRERSEGEARGREPPGSGRAGRPRHLNATPGGSASR